MSDKKTDSVASTTQHGAWYRRPASLLVVAIVVAAGAVALILNNNSAPAASVKTAHLLYVDSAKNTVTLTDSAAKGGVSLPYPPNAYVNYEAVAPDGGTLLSLSITSQNGGFIFIRSNKAQALSDEVVKTLRSAVVLNSSHQVFFIDNNTVVLVTCGASCKLISLNLFTGKTAEVVDSGVVPSNIPAPVYPLGVSNDAKSVYLRVIGANKLGKETGGALYQVDLASHKVLHTIGLSQEVGYTLSLSPDRRKLVYKSGGNGNPIDLHVIDVASDKNSTTKWSQGDIADQPSALNWSPDSSKILFRTVSLIMPANEPAASTKPIITAYLDVPKKTVTQLQSFDDPTHHNLPYQNWLGVSKVVYELDTASEPNNFTKPDIKVYSQDISSKKTTNLPTLGRLGQVVYW